jgi:hypothetical protein
MGEARNVGERRMDFTGIAALITAIGGIVFGAIQLAKGSNEREVGYQVLASRVADLTAQAKSNNDRIVALQTALATVASRAAAAPVSAAPNAPPPPPATELSNLATRLHMEAASSKPVTIPAVPLSLEAAVRTHK